MPSRLSHPFLSFLLLVLAPLSVRAEVVQTLTGRIEGKVVIEKGQVTVNGKAIAWTDILTLMPEGQHRTTCPQIITFKNGEVWAGELLGLSDRKLEFKSDLFGKHKIDLEQLAVIDLTPRTAPLAGLKPNTLYRDKGEPVPGELLTIDKEKLSVDSPLGVLNLPLAGLTRFVLDNRTQRVEKETDEIALTEGSLLRGKLQPVDKGLELEHALLGKLTFPVTAMRSIVRYRESAIHLTELPPRSVQTASLLGTGEAPARMQVLRGEEGARFVRALHLEPKTVVRYALPKRSGLQLRAMLDDIAGARGNVKIKISVGTKTIFDQEWKAGDKPRELVLDLPQGDELVIEVDFSAQLRFPCGVLLGDPFVVATKP